MKATAAASAEFLAVFRAAAGDGRPMDFAQFMELALYHPELGYYRQPRERVGYRMGTDFFTASTSGAVFGELVAAASAALVGRNQAPRCTFVEIGAEKNSSVLAGVEHPFASTRVIGIGEPVTLSGECVVFSNELFDAQPFRRFVHRNGQWRELGVALDHNRLVEIELSPVALGFLPPATAEGYVIDAPLAAASLATRIGSQPWTGLFIACDYGKSWAELTTDWPAGTARAYHRHVQGNDLLERPSEQDLTCHICWDWIESALVEQGFAPPVLQSQESFFIRNAADYLSRIVAADAARFSARKQSLAQLLHPGHLGQKFQVMHALRR